MESATTTTGQSRSSPQSDYDRDSAMTKGDEERRSATVLGAIGETIVEIAQTTKDLVIGGEDQTAQQQKRHTSTGQS